MVLHNTLNILSFICLSMYTKSRNREESLPEWLSGLVEVWEQTRSRLVAGLEQVVGANSRRRSSDLVSLKLWLAMCKIFFTSHRDSRIFTRELFLEKGSLNLPALSPSPQFRIGNVSQQQTPPPPTSPRGSPACCFHCISM